MGDLSEHFSKKEFACRCSYGCGFDITDPALIVLLEVIHGHYNVPIEVTCGCRCAKHNKEVGGAGNSLHLMQKNGCCKAADIKVSGVKATDVATWLETRYPNIGIGLYRKYPMMIHVDIRGSKARWTH